MSQIKYRPEVDGLRAVAVMAVLFYHAGFSQIPGGFMGVDIFFVISGFLITAFIVSDLKSNQFSLINFWERRARRILPPLFLVIFATLLASTFLLLPFDYSELGLQIASQSVFSSNILFAKQGGYFDTSSDLKALLHLWSLAVEEQFYLFYPIVMLIIARYFKSMFLPFIVIGIIISFILQIAFVEYYQRYVFYMLPFRCWELLAGSLVAVTSAPSKFNKNTLEAGSALGLFMIVLALFFYEDHMVFPGYVAALPVVGTALIIYCNKTLLTKVGSFLAIKPVIGIGLISYSLYLWHWPIMVLAKYYLIPFGEFTSYIGLVCIAASFILATLTWYYIEQPVRKKKVLSTTKGIYLFTMSGLVIMACVGVSIFYFKGIPNRLSENVIKYADAVYDTNPHRDSCDGLEPNLVKSSDVCQTNKEHGKPSFVVWGDSIGDSLAPAFYELSKEHSKNGFLITSRGCPPVLGIENNDKTFKYECSEFNDEVLALIVRENIKEVYLVGAWGRLTSEGKISIKEGQWLSAYKNRFPNARLAGLERTVDALKLNGAKVVLIENPPSSEKDIPRILALQELYGETSKYMISAESYTKSLGRGIGQYKTLTQNKDLTFLSPKAFLCDEDICHTEIENRSLYYDRSHLSAFGATKLKPMIEPVF